MAMAALMLASLGAACGDDEAAKIENGGTEQGASAHREKWLQPGSAVTPAQWMASRHDPKVRTLSDPAVARLDALLRSANALYRESERMIANRAVQLEGMLSGIGITESAVEVLDDLTAVAGEVGQTEGFGAVSQHYFNLRADNVSRADALKALKTRYGPRNAP